LLSDLIPKLAGYRILVVGDIILDEYLTGKATRMSREAPVPVLEFESRRLIPGGAANPATNIVALGSHATQVAIIGDDDYAPQLLDLLRAKNIATSGIFTDKSRPTTVKTRLMAHMGLRFPQQVARIDRVARHPIDASTQQHVIAFLQQHLQNFDAVLFSDYHGGLITSEIVKFALTHRSNTVLTADAQGELDKYRGFALVKCNVDEAAIYLRCELQTDAEFEAAAQTLLRDLDLTGAMVITRGGDGATFAATDGKVQHCPAPSVTDVFDTVGAGDTAIAVMTLAITGGATYDDAVRLANYASGIVVRRVGNYAPSPQELREAIKEG